MLLPPASSRPLPGTWIRPLASMLARSSAIRQGMPPGCVPRTMLTTGAFAAMPDTGSTPIPPLKLRSRSAALPAGATSAARNRPSIQVFMAFPRLRLKRPLRSASPGVKASRVGVSELLAAAGPTLVQALLPGRVAVPVERAPVGVDHDGLHVEVLVERFGAELAAHAR